MKTWIAGEKVTASELNANCALIFEKVFTSGNLGTFAENAIATVTHNLNITQSDLENGRYCVVISYGTTTGGNKGRVDFFESYNKLPFLNAWSSADPTSTYIINWQANTLKTKVSTGAYGSAYNYRVLIFKVW